MKLYERQIKRCVLIREESSDDGEGGVTVFCSDGAEFEAALIEKNLKSEEVGGRMCLLGTYDASLPAEYGIVLKNGDRFRSEDGQVYAVIGEGKTPPPFSVIRFAQYTVQTFIGEVRA